MSCNTYCNSTSTCGKASFSVPTYPGCTYASYVPAVPAHHFNLICNNTCMPIVCPLASPNHGVSSSAYNGYSLPTFITLPGHITSCQACPPSPSCQPCECNCNCCSKENI